MGVMKNPDEKFGAHVRALIEELDPVPEPPREEMWARIQAARRLPGQAPPRSARPAWLRWGGALAAMLALGFAIGRLAPADRPAAPTVVAQADSRAPAETAPAASYRLAAVQHLDAAEALLTGLPLDARAGGTEQVSEWAQDLLVTTRLLQDSPAAHDPQMAALFADLELVLAQIALLQTDREEEELELIQRSIRENDVLVRVRAVTNQRPVAGI
jgi:hypothetical protein